MRTFTHNHISSDLRRLSSGIKSAGAEGKVCSDAKKVVVLPSERDTDGAGGFTLDDLGGRSDALGG
jgi:hypothetical protein